MIDAKIVVDSSANMATDSNVSSVPLKIVTQRKEYIDDARLNVAEMVWQLQTYNGPSSTACPSPQDWLDTFDDKPYVFCIAITSNLSGSCNAANIAKADYELDYPDRKVCVIDSLSTGPEMILIAEKLAEYASTLAAHKTDYHTCHCTGTEQYEFMKKYMPQLSYLSCGESISI